MGNVRASRSPGHRCGMSQWVEKDASLKRLLDLIERHNPELIDLVGAVT